MQHTFCFGAVAPETVTGHCVDGSYTSSVAYRTFSNVGSEYKPKLALAYRKEENYFQHRTLVSGYSLCNLQTHRKPLRSTLSLHLRKRDIKARPYCKKINSIFALFPLYMNA